MVVLDDATLAQISTRARQISFGRTLLTLIAGLLFGLGWVTARVLGLLWLGLAWSAVAIKLGWTEGRKGVRQG